MRYKLLGNSGLRVSELCLGTMTFGEDWGWGSSQEESRKIYDTFLEAGGNFIDTANVYTNGTSERLLGEYSLIERTLERELLPMAADLGLGVTAWSPLAGGMLTGKQLEAGGAKDSRQSDAGMKQFMVSDARKEAIVREVVASARDCGHSPAQVALAWLRQQATPVIPIIGARKLAQLKDNLACIDIRLESAFIQRLDAVSRIEMGFPLDMLAKEMPRSLSYGGMWGQIDRQ